MLVLLSLVDRPPSWVAVTRPHGGNPMPTRALQDALAAVEHANIVADKIRRVVDRHRSGESSASEMQEETSPLTADLLMAAEKIRRAIIDFEVAKADTRLDGRNLRW
jgi:hypothetical protein